MDKQEATKRLDAIEREAKKLRKIIEGKKTVFDGDKLYIATKLAESPFILIGAVGNYKAFYSLKDTETRCGPAGNGQDCLDRIMRFGYTVHEFTDTREALTFFLENL